MNQEFTPLVRRCSRIALAVALGTAAAGCQQRASDRPWQVALQAAEFPPGSGTAEPQLTVRGDRAVLSWVVSAGNGLPGPASLKFAERTAAGWSAPRDVTSGDNWFVNSADVPSVVRLSDRSLAAHWLVSNSEENDEAYDLNIALSGDDGATWSAPVTPHHDQTKTQHGFATLFEGPGGGLNVVWLDGRAMPSEDVGAMALRAAAFDAAGKQVSESLIDDRVCECCPTAAASTADGPIVAFRNRGTDEIRDIQVARLTAGRWSEPTLVHQDGWMLSGCPVNGPAISADGRNVAVAWFTVQQGQGHSFIAFSSDAGRTFGAPVRLDEVGSTGHVAVTFLKDGSAVASWIEYANEKSQLQLRRVTSTGERSAAQAVGGAIQTSGFPRMARRGDELLLAWTESSNGSLRVRTAAATLPN